MHRLQQPDVVDAIARSASAHVTRPWKVGGFIDLDDRAYHPAGILLDDNPEGLNVFVKFAPGRDAEIAFTRERDGLRLLRDLGGARTATPVGDGVFEVNNGWVLALEAVTERAPNQRTRSDWRAIGTALGSLHATTGTTFGLDIDGSFGPLPQHNAPVESNRWCEFLRTRRIEPFLDAALRSGGLPEGFGARVDAVAERLEELGGPEPIPTLLHGDAQQNNYLSTDKGAVFVDAHRSSDTPRTT